jgi:undecaprenyl diphosphate synthase
MSSATAHLSAEGRASLPQHVAVIMDGNGRWAKQHGLPRVEGHRRGADSAREIIRTAGELGIKYLTLYAFSAENWNRPKDEVDALMKYLIHYLKTETPELNKKQCPPRSHRPDLPPAGKCAGASAGNPSRHFPKTTA